MVDIRSMLASSRYVAPFAPQGSHAVDADLAHRLLRLALDKGGEYADLFFEYRASGSFVLDEGSFKQASKGVTLGLGVRVQHGEATGYAYTEQLTWEAMQHAATVASHIAAGGRAHAPVSVRSLQEKPARYPFMHSSLEATGMEKRQLLERASEAGYRFDSRVLKMEATFTEELREILLFTSEGFSVHDVQPLFRFGVRAIVQQGENRQEGSSGGGGRTTLQYFAAKSPEQHAEEAVRLALRLLEAEEAPAGQMDVILAPGDSGILLHEAVGHGLEADFNRKGTSRYSGQIGAKVASELCTVVDDATLPHGRGSLNVDDEGNIPQCTPLIEQGRLVGYMNDRLSSKQAGSPSNGHGRRESFACVPLPRMTNTLLLAGKQEPEEILRSVKRGIYACKFGGGQVDIANGDFVFSLTEGYLVEEGKLGAPLKGVTLIGNGPDVLSKVTMVGNDLAVSDGIWTCGKDGQSVPVGVGCPTLKISGMTVGGTRIGL